MTVYLWLAAVVAGVASVVAWRRRWNRLVVAGGGGLAGVLALVAWLAMPKADVEAGARPDDWLVDSAVALNRAAMTPVSRESGSAAATGGSLPELAERLAARLAKAPDDAEGWALLAVTYRHLGREQEAEALVSAAGRDG